MFPVITITVNIDNDTLLFLIMRGKNIIEQTNSRERILKIIIYVFFFSSFQKQRQASATIEAHPNELFKVLLKVRTSQ